MLDHPAAAPGVWASLVIILPPPQACDTTAHDYDADDVATVAAPLGHHGSLRGTAKIRPKAAVGSVPAGQRTLGGDEGRGPRPAVRPPTAPFRLILAVPQVRPGEPRADLGPVQVPVLRGGLVVMQAARADEG